MRRLIFVTGALILAGLTLYGCGGGTTNVSINTSRLTNSAANAMNTAVNTMSSAANTVANTVSSATTSSPESFLEDAAQGGMAEVELGKLASTKAQNPELKKFGQMMVADHGKANTELKALAAKKNITLPKDMGSHQSTLDKLKGMSGADFDRTYVDQMVEDHEADVAAFEKQAANSTDPDVKAFAAKTLPVLKKHLEAIRAIQSKMEERH